MIATPVAGGRALPGGYVVHYEKILENPEPMPRSIEVNGKRLAVLIVLPILMVAAVSAQDQPGGPPQQPASNAPKPLPGANDPSVAGASVDPGTYIIGPADVLRILVFRDQDLTGFYSVRPDGMITVPLFGDMKASGLTPVQLTKQLKEALSEKYKDPEVTVQVYDVRSKTYEVIGGVKRPGPYPLIEKTTVFDAINNAGGFLDAFANRKDILIIRGAKGRFHFNYKKYLDGKDADKNIELQSGDVVSIKD